MKIGLPKEIKNNEGRVGLTPHAVSEFIKAGHTVFVEKNAGVESGFNDEEYIKAGASIVDTKTAWDQPMIVKVKEPLESEYKYFKENQIIYTYFHLAGDRALTDALMNKKVISVAYETMVKDGRLPLLAPMSRVAGRRSVIIAATHLEKHHGGEGILPGGVLGTEKGQFVIIGGGVAGENACRAALGLGANVTILDSNPKAIEFLNKCETCHGLTKIFGNKYIVETATPENIAKWVKQADAVISTVLVRGASAPKVVSEAMVKTMKKGSVIIDIAIDQGGSIETVDHITTHDKPTYVKHGVIHYAVANMPGATPRTATAALVHATTEYGLILAKEGIKAALHNDTILTGINTISGHLTCEPVSKTFTDIKLYDAKELVSKL